MDWTRLLTAHRELLVSAAAAVTRVLTLGHREVGVECAADDTSQQRLGVITREHMGGLADKVGVITREHIGGRAQMTPRSSASS